MPQASTKELHIKLADTIRAYMGRCTPVEIVGVLMLLQENVIALHAADSSSDDDNGRVIQ